MKRREFIGLISGVAATWPLVVRAQQRAVPVIGYLSSASSQGHASYLAGFHDGLREGGFIEGQNVTIEYRWANGQYQRLPDLAADLVRRHVALIAAGSTPAALAAKAATTTIPIVFEMAGDPVRIGLVAGLDRPGGNVTGVANMNIQMTPKRLQLLHEAVPSAKVMALLEAFSVAPTLGVGLHVLHASTERDLDAVFANLIQSRAGGLVIAAEPLFSSLNKQFAELTVRHAVPAITGGRDFAAAGGLLSYGADTRQAYRLAGIYTGQVLKGEKPANLPIQQSTKVELVINLKTAKVLGIDIPNALIGRADEVIE